jgi:hypothetical protein
MYVFFNIFNYYHAKLTHYFKMCANNQNNLIISNLRYIDFSKHFIWKSGSWHQKKEMVKR